MIEITAEQLPAVFMKNLRSLGLNPVELSKSLTTITAKTDHALFSEVSLYVRRTIKGMDSVARGGRGSEVVCEFQFKLRNPPSGEGELQAITRGFLRREVVGYQWVGSDNIVSRLNREDVTQAALSLGFEKVGYGDGRIKMRYKSPESIVRKGLFSYETHVYYRELGRDDINKVELIAKALQT